MKKRKSKRYVGVYLYDSEKNADITYYITYRQNNKMIWDKVGRKSEGYKELDAHKKRIEKLQILRDGKKLGKEIFSLNQLYDDYYSPYIEKQKKTHRHIKSIYETHIRDTLGNFVISDIKQEDLLSLKRDLQKKNLEGATIFNVLKLIRQIWNYSKELHLHNTNHYPFVKSVMSFTDNKRERYLTKQEIKILLDTLYDMDYQTYLISKLSLYTGMRKGEIVNLKKYNLNFDNGYVDLLGSQTKTGKPRMIKLKEDLLNELQEWAKDRKIEDYVFKNKTGNPFQHFYETFRKSVKECKLNNGETKKQQNKVVFHTLRHTFASHLAMNDTPIHIIQQLLGHSNIDTTMRYSHLIPSAGDKYIENISY